MKSLTMTHRKNSVLLFIFLIVALFAFPAPLLAQDEPTPPADLTGDPAADAWPGEYIVTLNPAAGEVSAAQAQLAQAGDLLEQVTACGSTTVLQVWRLDDAETPQALLTATGDPAVLAIEPNWIVRAAGIPPLPPTMPETPFTFDDTYYASRQWPLQRSDFARAWQLVQVHNLSTQKVRVAVIDSGVDFSHPDLAGRLLSGINYVTTNAQPNDDFGHGTHVSGIIAAIANNGKGIVGGAPHVEIDPLKMLGSSGNGSIVNLVKAICDAADRGADVINMSLEVPTSISSSLADQMQSAVDYAYAEGSVLVAAGGNSNGGPVYYPARLNHVIAVAALTPENTRASYSAVGTQLDIAAGGGSFTKSVLSTWPSSVPGKCTGTGRVLLSEGGAYYCTEPGTSMAAPLVSAAAALLLAVQPTLTNVTVEAILEETARDIGLDGTEAGAGLLNAEAAVRRILKRDAVLTPTSLGAAVPPGAAPFTQTVIIESPSLVAASVTGTVAATNWFKAVNLVGNSFYEPVRFSHPLYLTFTISPTYLSTGAYNSTALLGVTGVAGESALSVPISVGVGNFIPSIFLPLIGNGGVPATPASAAAPPFTWETPISPTVLSMGGSGWTTAPLPFVFPLSGVDTTDTANYALAYVYEDGFVAFSEGNHIPVPTPSITQCLPMLSQPVQGVFGWWADLDLSR
ncbi:S8 family serine peptidase, partial [Caldilinea sp.]|uniref:S8 family peptidase n=1 Tax=Caldilinea sp. TaxID=2293560 RepID=UPI002BD8BFD4|nr:S8 family serine peptidase [Caldilinea sp.]